MNGEDVRDLGVTPSEIECCEQCMTHVRQCQEIGTDPPGPRGLTILHAVFCRKGESYGPPRGYRR